MPVKELLAIQRCFEITVRPAFLELEDSDYLVWECMNCDELGVFTFDDGIEMYAYIDDKSYVTAGL